MLHSRRFSPLGKIAAASAAVCAVLVSAMVTARAQQPAANQPAAKFEELFQDASASYRPFVISELRFIRKACGLSALELKPIVQEAARLLKDVATKAAKAEQKNRQNLGKVMQKADDSGPEPMFDPLTAISRGLRGPYAPTCRRRNGPDLKRRPPSVAPTAGGSPSITLWRCSTFICCFPTSSAAC